MTLGKRIGIARERAELNKSQLARRVGVHPSSAIEWEKDRKNPSVENLIKIAVITQVAFEWLATGRGNVEFSESIHPGRVAESVGVYDALSDDESALLRTYRIMSEKKKKALLDLIGP